MTVAEFKQNVNKKVTVAGFDGKYILVGCVVQLDGRRSKLMNSAIVEDAYGRRMQIQIEKVDKSD